MTRVSHAARAAALFMLVTASCLLGLSRASSAQSGVWSEVIDPPTVSSALAIYDPVRDQLVRACGSSPLSSVPFDRTWVLSQATHHWSALPATLPGMLSGSAIYDPLRDRMLAIGYTGGAVNARCWTLPLASPASWTEQAVIGAGPTSSGQEGSILYDSVADRVIALRYGEGGLGGVIETRCISLAGTLTWSLLATTNAPPARAGMTCVFDPVRYAVWVFAGEVFIPRGSGLRNEVWKLDLTTNAWSLIAFAGQQPAVRKDHSAIYDPVGDRMCIFGGPTGTWQLTLSGTPEWTPIGTATAPAARGRHSAVYDSQRGAMIVTGGAGAGAFNDTWSLNLSGAPEWTDIAPGGTLAPHRLGQSSVFDVLGDRMLVFGGNDGTQFSNEVRELDRAGEPQWQVMTPAGIPPAPRYFQTGVWDATLRRMLVFGGYDGSAYRNDLWALTMSDPPAWTMLSPTGTPPPARAKHTAVVDASRDRMIVFGGETAGGIANNDAWQLQLSTLAWSPVPTSGAPPPARSWHSAIYDPQGDRMVVYGGTGPSAGHLGDLWSLAGSGAWNPISATGSAPARFGHTAVLDPLTHEMLVYAGDPPYPVSLADDTVRVLSLSGPPAWQPRPPVPGNPILEIRFHTSIYDPIHRAMIVVGGGSVYGGSVSNTPAFQFSLPQLLGVTSPPAPLASHLQLAVSPQPSHGETRVSFYLPIAGTVRITMLDLAGRTVARLEEGVRTAGHHEFVWRGGTANAPRMGPGIYWVRLSTGNDAATRRLVIVE